MADGIETRRMTRLIKTRVGTRAIATHRIIRLDKILVKEIKQVQSLNWPHCATYSRNFDKHD